MFAQKIKMSVAKVSPCFNPLFNPDLLKCFLCFILLPLPVLLPFSWIAEIAPKAPVILKNSLLSCFFFAPIEGGDNSMREF
ncbi:hypothetical protein [Methanosarcina sp. WH1]|uniref:hypothetical protein n=1 Tax=Methanosarcina sp. WH1 TaxID=1434102 RepID=UPI0018CD1983|nr:hypothetical protein [Methanosarcina sp. WH1]